MLNMTSLSANLNCEPPLAVFLALKLHSQTRSKKLVELLHNYALSVSYKKVLSIESIDLHRLLQIRQGTTLI